MYLFCERGGISNVLDEALSCQEYWSSGFGCCFWLHVCACVCSVVWRRVCAPASECAAEHVSTRVPLCIVLSVVFFVCFSGFWGSRQRALDQREGVGVDIIKRSEWSGERRCGSGGGGEGGGYTVPSWRSKGVKKSLTVFNITKKNILWKVKAELFTHSRPHSDGMNSVGPYGFLHTAQACNDDLTHDHYINREMMQDGFRAPDKNRSSSLLLGHAHIPTWVGIQHTGSPDYCIMYTACFVHTCFNLGAAMWGNNGGIGGALGAEW